MTRTAELLREVQSQLDIPEHLADEAAAEFRRVADWLAHPTSPLRPYDPDLYPQGSFRLGTPVRPLGKDDFDIDLVCTLTIAKDKTTQANLKLLVGDRLKADADLKARLSESRRCWQLAYRPKFHLDILPSIPDPAGVPSSILLTDKDLHHWQFSNPAGFADWFLERMRVEWEEARRVIAESIKANVEDVPVWKIRTPLQRAVQLLKRHRDIRFSGDPTLMPISIIITTLAGRAYRPRPDLAQTVLDLTARMPEYIEKRDGKWWVENPAQPKENFADKWNEKPGLKDAFTEWLETLREDVDGLAASTEAEASEIIEERFAINLRKAPVVQAAAIPSLGDRSHAKAPPWPRNLKYGCRVNAQMQFRKGGPLLRMGRFLFKNNELRFEATTDAPPPYEVQWQVVNTGAEAKAAGQLRGGFDPGQGRYGTVRLEHTRYKGTHQVRAFVLKDGILVAMSEPALVRITQ